MDENVKFVPKDMNPPNAPPKHVQLRQKVYEGGWETETEQQLIRCIKSRHMLHPLKLSKKRINLTRAFEW